MLHVKLIGLVCTASVFFAECFLLSVVYRSEEKKLQYVTNDNKVFPPVLSKKEGIFLGNVIPWSAQNNSRFEHAIVFLVNRKGFVSSLNMKSLQQPVSCDIEGLNGCD